MRENIKKQIDRQRCDRQRYRKMKEKWIDLQRQRYRKIKDEWIDLESDRQRYRKIKDNWINIE